MKTLKQIYEEAGLEKPNLYTYKENPQKFRQKKSESIIYHLNKEDEFFLSKNIVDKMIDTANKTYEKSFSDESTIYNEIYYSSKIEGIKIDKPINIDKQSSAFLFQKSYEMLLKEKEITHETLSSLLGILSNSNDGAFEKMTENKVGYRKDRVGVYKGGKYMEGELIHEGLEPSKIKESMQNIFNYMNVNSGSYLDIIIEAATTHLMFEYIHPYYDGNGRIGRMLMFWYLRNSEYPELSYHLSQIIDANRNKYYESMEFSQKTKNLDYFTMYMFNVCIESLNIEIELQSILKYIELTKAQLNFLRKLLISGIKDREISYPLVKEYFNDTHSKPAFFKMINILIDLEIIKVDESGKTNKYSLNK